jgi:hypothetical protein
MSDRKREIFNRLSKIKEEWHVLTGMELEAHDNQEYAKVTQCFADKTVLFGEEMELTMELMRGA